MIMIHDTKRKTRREDPEVAALRKDFWAASNDDLFDRRSVAAALNVSISLLEKYATTGGGPPYLELGRLRRYRKGDLLGWYSRTVRQRWSTSDDGATRAAA
jgi:hypothetical protein